MKKLLFFLLISNLYLSQWSISNSERNLLIQIYNSTDGINWNRTWDLEKDPRTWFGVVVKNGSVMELNLANNSLKGNFPTAILPLKNLSKLDLSNNTLTGEVPLEISSFYNLSKLDISNNFLTGNPSNSISKLTLLEDLGLGGNRFQIEDVNFLIENLKKLKILNLTNSQIIGVPTKITSLPNLETLILDNNKIDLNSYGNLASLSKLKMLSLSGNNLSKIPNEISQLIHLTSLNLSHNKIDENQTSILSKLTNLEWLSISNNNLYQIPSELLLLKKLKTLDLSRNHINGNLSYISKLKNLQQIFLNNNQITGLFPTELLDMPALMMVNLNSNNLNGSLPYKLPKITQISNNRFEKENLAHYISNFTEQTELDYSPQRYDSPKTVLAIVGESATLDQSIRGDYTFSWFKNLDEKLDIKSENLYINRIDKTSFATYTAEAYSYQILKNKTLFDLSHFREPITLSNVLATLENSDHKSINIYPNPTSDFINIISWKYQICNVVIFDLSGKQMISSRLNNIDVSNLPSGIYIISITTKDGKNNFKFIKN